MASMTVKRREREFGSGGSQVGGYEVPVHQLLQVCGHVVGAAVLVVQVVGVLPDVQAKDRDEARLGRAWG